MFPKRRYHLQPRDAYPDDGLFDRTVVFGRSVGHGRWMGEAVYTDLDFVNCDISKVDFFNADFTNVTFVGCVLRGTHMTAANLSGVTFTDCDIEGMDFYAAHLDRVCASDKNWGQGLFQGAFLSKGSAIPTGYVQRRALCNDIKPRPLSRHTASTGAFNRNGELVAPAPRDSHRGQLVYSVLEYELDTLGPHAAFLLREHPRIAAAKLAAMGRALDAPLRDFLAYVS